MGLKVYAEGVRTPADLAVLWAIGFDGASGPVVGNEP
jgi:EAL domain-containing protein (putative c-di-GMP-specific phosphodiesterase class I)